MQVHIDPPPTPKIASMDMTIAVGFGKAYVTKDGETIFNENDVDDFSKCWRS